MTLPEPPLLADQRRERLLADLRAHGSLRVSEIARALGVTTVTVRRDIAQLVDEGAIERVHGGVRLPRGTEAQPQVTAAVEDPARPPGGDEATLPVVGMVVPSLDYYWPEIIRGARDAAPDAGVRVVLRGSSYADVADVHRQASWLVDTVGAQGLLIAPPTLGDEAAALITWLAGLAVPVVFVERTATVGPFHEYVESVSTDHAFGASLAVRHLVAEGHRRIGFLASGSSPTTAAVRRGWQRTAVELGLELDGTPEVICADHREPSWSDDVGRTIDACLATGTTALLVHSDREAISLVARCEDRGIQVPRDLAVVAYDDEIAGLTNPALSAVRPAKYTIGETAMQLLARRIQGGADRPVHRVRISPQLIVRDSSRVRARP
ncbi:substrate-binding domain-containing protein [Catellatospora sp. KI3]|uniref:substrate-binding domain-containing protein n=1 Tax=Catellatospora sp. KI3 TaxID=3041620 RepID=UPI002482931A|nr:substrate-binding domain-containing protein [Catellatospora sp. KI3]MDI1462592.1 substrate-binding domain-containing protein [Catellatospora sp. KI3]